MRKERNYFEPFLLDVLCKSGNFRLKLSIDNYNLQFSNETFKSNFNLT
jgi:hypothetical protein